LLEQANAKTPSRKATKKLFTIFIACFGYPFR
jgi:hypothetical protein